eukprot:3621846-Rhodomonas_salina.1
MASSADRRRLNAPSSSPGNGSTLPMLAFSGRGVLFTVAPSSFDRRAPSLKHSTEPPPRIPPAPQKTRTSRVLRLPNTSMDLSA